jgi:hypothetical protein
VDDRTLIAALAMQGILVGAFGERPNAKPAPDKIAAHAVLYSDALREALKKTPDPCEPPPTPKV